jgi:hypothetical protein
MNEVISPRFRKLPFSRAMTDSMITGCAGELLALFQLQGKTRVIAADARSGMELERRFRLRWWEHMDDPLKLSMHNLGIGIEEKVSQDPALIPALHNAWAAADKLTHGAGWRKLIRQLSGGGEAGKQYTRIFFRIAQQMVNRGARWEAVFGASRPTPYTYLYEFITGGLLPLGFHDNTFYLHQLSGAPAGIPLPGSPPREPAGNRICLCYEFANKAPAALLKNRLEEEGYELFHGPVSDYRIPIESQLASRILHSFAVIVLAENMDPDFGLPVWIFQEMDFAIAAGRPVIVITPGNNGEMFGAPVIPLSCPEGGLEPDTIYPQLSTILNRLTINI